jgi:hypothetical protein
MSDNPLTAKEPAVKLLHRADEAGADVSFTYAAVKIVPTAMARRAQGQLLEDEFAPQDAEGAEPAKWRRFLVGLALALFLALILGPIINAELSDTVFGVHFL